ncbi:prolyl-tRNA editing enzyme YbaK/EbsC (Cys-tRNA(Pro) deacylase) [Ruminiclostridium sufflavum DSM 19573]|uniref:Prolyl-tRNA editing enzyme YbaK/EbsC (Cys-tRNA(Pro) deacylase) n=1 Tax=Ruminiclostridium sufflavum DSM 19573 TaxID=1121337 RepID=A0A318XQ72_9FIRM|nr:YbaK/EbsC family protein [Ruminiclostridium sufflavum]PYG90225.1 prolyl-tRNA editing enzyme YbaK/EbsC (Cys-tRNA(Pro) deacylase) [Ruminiclostridium sufflavum DSM 19573]
MKAISLNSIKELLQKHDILYEIIHDESHIYSVSDAAGIYNLSQTVPVLVVKTDKGYFAVIMSGERRRVDFELLKEALKCEKVKLADKKDVFKVTGYEAGSVPMVGHGLPGVFDNRLLLQKFVYGGAGQKNYTLKIDPRDIERITEIVAKID